MKSTVLLCAGLLFAGCKAHESSQLMDTKSNKEHSITCWDPRNKENKASFKIKDGLAVPNKDGSYATGEPYPKYDVFYPFRMSKKHPDFVHEQNLKVGVGNTFLMRNIKGNQLAGEHTLIFEKDFTEMNLFNTLWGRKAGQDDWITMKCKENK